VPNCGLSDKAHLYLMVPSESLMMRSLTYSDECRWSAQSPRMLSREAGPSALDSRSARPLAIMWKLIRHSDSCGRNELEES
jgi:hypothetical protein